MQNTQTTVAGVLHEIRFYKDNYLIGVLEDGVSVKGNMISPQKGMEYRFEGRWQSTPRFGDTFCFSEYQASYPRGLSGIRAYLEENCKHIGPEISKMLVNTFGEATLHICKEEPARVAAEISGLTPQRAAMVSAMLKQNEANEELQIRLKDILAGTGVSRRVINRIIESYAHKAPDIIQEDPYRLIEQIEGVGFKTADEMAVKVGFEKEGRSRISAGIVHVLKESAFGDGHTCLPVALLLIKARSILQVDEERIAEVLRDMLEQGHLLKNGEHISVPFYKECETAIAEKLKALAAAPAEIGVPQLEGLHADQIEAMHTCMRSGVFILTGPPGTGKTFTIKKIIQSFPDANIALAAPTGKAAKRMYEESGMLAMTIHKLLEPQKNGRGFHFTRDADNPIDADVIVLDEMSMIDVSLMASFLDAVAPGTRLIMVGDTYQLPSVGPGNVLRDMITSGELPCVELSIIKRQDEGLIIRNCHSIKNGQDIVVENSTAEDFYFLKRNTPAEIQETVFDLLTNRLQQAYGYDPLQEVQILSPLREKTMLSCKALNERCQAQLNPNPPIKNCRFRVGDKVIQTRNQYELDIINGDIGYVRSINRAEKTIYVDFENPSRRVQIPMFDNNLDLAYAITVHKFQGSEAPVIIIPVHKCFGTLITQRNLLYTAVSRAKKLCIVVGQRSEIPKMINRNKQARRFTGLKRMLQNGST